MASTNCLILSVLAMLITSSSGLSLTDHVSSECSHTTYPTLCEQTLRELGPNTPNFHFLSALVNKTIYETELLPARSHAAEAELIQSQAGDQLDIDYCEELVEMSLKRLNQAKEAIERSPQKYKDDILTWLSAALTFQQTCKDAVVDGAPSNLVLSEIDKKMDYLLKLSSNPLALANRIGDHEPKNGEVPTGRGRRLLEDEIFPRWVSRNDRKLLQSSEVKADAVVAKDGSGNFRTIAAAIEAATGGRYVIYVKSGTYNEKIKTSKDGITLIGDGKYSTIISSGGSVGEGSSLRGSATFTVTGDGFIARDIGFENTAGASAHQAIALTVSSDHSVLYRCSLVGNQDTLYALSLRQFYRECDIHGTVDFIFGNAAAVFQSCSLTLRRPRGAYDVILANGRSDPGQNTGFSVQNCKISGGSDYPGSTKSYLGRPWKAYSRAVVMQSNIDGVIHSRGWVEWSGSSSSVYNTLYFGEYDNMGGGGGISGRVNWGGFHALERAEAEKFTVAGFIGGNSWLPSTGVTFVSGL